MRTTNTTLLAVIVIGLYLLCCAMAMGQTAARGGAPVPETNKAEQVSALMKKNGGSLFRASAAVETQSAGAATPAAEVSFIAVPPPEPKTVKKHDLVTIIVREQSEFSASGTTDLKKQAAINAQLEQFIRFQLGKGGVKVTGDALSSPLAIKAGADANFKGEGSVDRSDSFTARVQAEIVDVKPNGTLVLQGSKTIKNDDEEQKFIVTGTCRAEDLTPDNTVLSTQLLDLNLEKQTKGPIRSANKKGWLPKLLDALNPF